MIFYSTFDDINENTCVNIVQFGRVEYAEQAAVLGIGSGNDVGTANDVFAFLK